MGRRLPRAAGYFFLFFFLNALSVTVAVSPLTVTLETLRTRPFLTFLGRLTLTAHPAFLTAFFTGAVPVQQIRDIAAAGEVMPPKSTYFFPKVLTGLLFNTLDEE